MELQNSFVVPAGLEAAWNRLLDVESVAPAMPGATLTSRDGDGFTGTVKVKLGPISMVYEGKAEFVTKDATEHRAVIEAGGKDTRGTSTARANVVAQLTEEGTDRTRVDVTTDLVITGRPAQFGRGVLQDVAGRIIDQFAVNLAATMAEPAGPEAVEPDEPVSPTDETAAVGEPEAPASAVDPASVPSADDAIDLLDAAGGPVLRRVAPVAGAVVLLALLWWLLRRRR